MPRKTARFIVDFDLPSGASRAGAAKYILFALINECKGLHPSEPMHNLDGLSIRVIPEDERKPT